MKRSILHNDRALDRILRIQHKGICMWCPRILHHISNLLPPHQHKGICMWCPLSAMWCPPPPHQQSSSSCRHFAPPASSTTRFVSEQRQKRPFVSLCPRPCSIFRAQSGFKSRPLSRLPHAHRGSNFHQLFPRNARSRVKVRALNHLVNSQRPACGSTTVQRPVLTGKRVVVTHFKPAPPTALSHPIA